MDLLTIAYYAVQKQSQDSQITNHKSKIYIYIYICYKKQKYKIKKN